jgi:hypothetical protein
MSSDAKFIARHLAVEFTTRAEAVAQLNGFDLPKFLALIREEVDRILDEKGAAPVAAPAGKR